MLNKEKLPIANNRYPGPGPALRLGVNYKAIIYEETVSPSVFQYVEYMVV